MEPDRENIFTNNRNGKRGEWDTCGEQMSHVVRAARHVPTDVGVEDEPPVQSVVTARTCMVETVPPVGEVCTEPPVREV